MTNALSEVQDTFLSLDRNYRTLLAACQNDGQRSDLMRQYADADQAYEVCVGHILAEDDGQILALSTQLHAVNAQIAQAVTFMSNMDKVIATVTEAVSLGGELIGLAGL